MCDNSRDLKNSCLLPLTETWLTDEISNNCVSLEYCVGEIEIATNQELGVFACTSMNAGVRKRR